jgi:membrane peptidoglycan carboxypeptidase
MSLAQSPRKVLGLIGAFVATSMTGGLLAAGLVLPAAGATGILVRNSATFVESLPSELETPPPSEISRLLAADGSVITTFFEENRRPIDLDKISPFMQKAIVAIEDSRFYEHGGVDPKGLARAAVVNQITGRVSQGASTLTQQYVKNVLVESAAAAGNDAGAKAAREKTNSRKAQEIVYAVALEKQFSKDEILKRYLNIASFGGTINGVEAAARYYFRTTAAKLTLPQAATLAGVVQLPGKYNPEKNPEAALERRNTVLNRMLELKVIDQAARDAAVATKLETKITPVANGCANTKRQQGYYCEYVRRLILGSDDFSALGDTPKARENTLKRGGLTIKTAMDPKVMTAAWKAVKTISPKDKSNVSAAAVTVEAGTGKILAIQQNKTFSPNDEKKRSGRMYLNYAVDEQWGGSSGFPTGSTFKPFTLAEWLNSGKSLNAVVPSSGGNAPYSSFTACGSPVGGGTYPYNNADEGRTSNASMSVWDGTAGSVNGVYISMEKQLDLCKIRKTAENLGVHLAAPRSDECDRKKRDAGILTTRLPTCIPALTLGVASISPMTLAGAYAGFADSGNFCKPTAVLQILDRDKKPLKIPGAGCKQTIDKDVANGVNLGLSRALTNGTASRVGVLPDGRPASGKTGTTNDSVDTWFVGYTRQLATAVWVGDPYTYPTGAEDRNGNPIMARKSLNYRTINGVRQGSVYGATFAGLIWKKIMVPAVEGMPVKRFDPPSSRYLVSPKKAVPDVRGKSPEEAKSILEDAGFETTISGRPTPSQFPAGTVASTSPGGGTSASLGSTITIVLSSGGGIDPGNGNPGNGNPGNGPGGPGQNDGNILPGNILPGDILPGPR